MYEIERKFLIKDNSWIRDISEVLHIRQGYLMEDASKKSLRIRKSNNDYTMTFKMPVISFYTHTDIEIEKSITKEEFDLLFNECEFKLAKIRHIVYHDGRKWEIDMFTDKILPNGDVYMCEIELNSEDDKITLPSWVGEEVTHNRKYKNINIVKGAS